MTFCQDLREDTVRSLPIRKAIAIQSHTLLRAAIAMMRNEGLGCAVIVNHQRQPIGIFTEHSVIDALARGVGLDDRPVCEFVDPDFFCVRETDPILRVWELVCDSAARFVCVTDREGTVVGITGQRGLAEYLADCFAGQVTVQRLGSNPWMSQQEGA